MTKSLLLVGAIACAAGLLAVPRMAQAQVEVDRVVSRVSGRVITLSDVRQASMLHLVGDTSSDDAVLRALENRLLILDELSRAAPLPPATDEDLGARRSEWLAALGGADAGALRVRAGMGEADLSAWMRDDVRINAYLRRQFGMLTGPEREKATADWVARLRQRADLQP